MLYVVEFVGVVLDAKGIFVDVVFHTILPGCTEGAWLKDGIGSVHGQALYVGSWTTVPRVSGCYFAICSECRKEVVQ